MIALSAEEAIGWLVGATAPDPDRTETLVELILPGWPRSSREGNTLHDGTYPPEDVVYAGSFEGVDVVCSRSLMLDRPSELSPSIVEASQGRRLVLHAMHSVSDWLAFAVWEDGRLIRSLSLAPDSGVIEDIGEPLPFELPYWAGDHPVVPIEGRPGSEKPYPLPFHPLELGEDALSTFFGFTIEGFPDYDIDPDAVELLGFNVTDPDTEGAAERKAAFQAAVAAMGPPRRFTFQADGSLVEISDQR
ncbi:DUF6928 family protein [Actinocorallia lasiicapitis]